MIKLKYNSLSEWRVNNKKAYEAAYSRNLLEKICKTFGWKNNLPHGYWTKEKSIEDANKYKTITEWRKNSSCYGAIFRKGWIEECTKHMNKIKQKPNGYWTKEKCLEEAKKYPSISKWQQQSPSSYISSVKLGFKNECCLHMKTTRKPKGYWTKEKCVEDALKYETKVEWERNSGGYMASGKNKWTEECCRHMKKRGDKL
jgi:hypothetical protein